MDQNANERSRRAYELLYRRRSPFIYTAVFLTALLAFSTIGLGFIWEFMATAHHSHSPFEVLLGPVRK